MDLVTGQHNPTGQWIVEMNRDLDNLISDVYESDTVFHVDDSFFYNVYFRNAMNTFPNLFRL